MSSVDPSKSKPASMADYLIRYDLRMMMEVAQADYSDVTSGVPRLLEQKDIAARFKKPKPLRKEASE
jgi:hypothetical protein